MAVAFVRTHTGANNKASAQTTIDIGISTATTPGNLLVLGVIFDNAATASKPVVSSVAKPAGETNSWVSLGAARSTSTTAGLAVSGELWCIRTTVSWPVAVYNVTLDTATTMRATAVQEFSGALAAIRSTTGSAYSTATTPASATTTGTTPSVGDLAVGLMFHSNTASFVSSDTDTTGGTWSATSTFGTTGQSAATNNFGAMQYKVLTGANHQTYNAAASLAANNGSIVAVLQQYVPPSITQAAYRLYADGTETGSTALAAQDTSYTADVSSGDVNLQLRMRLQNTSAIVGDPWDDYQLQWEKNASGSWTDVRMAGSEILADSQETGGVGGNLGSDATTTRGQSFIGNGQQLTKAGFGLYKLGSPTTTITAALYAHTGTYGAFNGTGTGSPLAVSTGAPLATASLTTSPVWTYFNFDGAYKLVNGTPYVIVAKTNTVQDTSNCGRIDTTTSETHGGISCFDNPPGTWVTTSHSGESTFRVYTALPSTTAVPADSANLTNAAVTTARLTAGTGSFVAGKVSEDGLVDDLALTANNYTELLYSITLKQADLANSDTLRFRVVRNGATTGLTYTQTPTISITKIPIAITQGAYRFYDVGTESGSTALAAQDTAPTVEVANGPQLQLRTRLQSTTAVAPSATDDWGLQYELNLSGTWSTINPITVPVAGMGAGLTDKAATTNRLSAGTGSFVTGKVSTTGTVQDLGWSGTSYTEVVYGLTLEPSALSNGDTLRFRTLRNGATTEMTYTQIPTVTITKTLAPPVASFSASATTITAGQTITFTDTSTNTPISWSWAFGGPGATPMSAITQGPHTVTYATAGTYTVNLSCTNDDGGDVSDDTLITVNPVVTAPVTSFTASTLAVTTGGTVTFTDTSTGGAATTWAWDFGAGANPATATTAGPHTVTYATAGTSTVTYTAGNTGGSVAATPKSVVVSAPVTGGGKAKVYTGGAWTEKPAKIYVAGAWTTKPLKRWNGSAWVPLGGAAPWTPASLTGLASWYDAADASTFTYSSGSVISEWRDKFGSKHLSKSVSNQPTRVADPAVWFDGNQYLQFSGNTGLDVGTATVFVVAEQINHIVTAGLFVAYGASDNDYGSLDALVLSTGGGGGGTWGDDFEAARYYLSATSGISYHVGTTPFPKRIHSATFRADGTFDVYVDGVIGVGGPRAGTFGIATGGYIVGARYLSGIVDSGYRFNGKIEEIVVYSRVLTDPERVQVQDYLKLKWGTP